MKNIKAFISYSSEEKKTAGLLKEFMKELCGYEVFLAHDDMIPSTDFKAGIKKAISDCDFFIPLISTFFSQSVYTDQEVGMAIILDKKIIPVKIDINPYGFLSDYHALPLNSDSIESVKQLVSSIGILALKHFKGDHHEKAKNSIVKALHNSLHFRNSNIIIEILCQCPKYNKKHIQSIVDAIKTNYEVKGAFGLAKLKALLKSRYKTAVETSE